MRGKNFILPLRLFPGLLVVLTPLVAFGETSITRSASGEIVSVDDPPLPERVIHLPPNESVGYFWTRPQDGGQFFACVEAKGDIHVPAETEACLIVTGSAPTDLKFLRSFGANEIQELVLGNKAIDDPALTSIRKLIGLGSLTIGDSQVTDSGLASLEPLTKLEFLCLDFRQLTDDGLVHLYNMKSLITLLIDRTHCTGAGMVNLKGLTKLECLKIEGIPQFASTSIRGFGTGIGALKVLPHLSNLEIMDATIGDKDLAALAEFPALINLKVTVAGADNPSLSSLDRLCSRELRLSLALIGVSDAGLAHLACLTPRSLSITSNSVSDAGMAYLGNLTSLGFLDLFASSKVGDAGLAYLKELSGLRFLSINGTSITPTGLNALKQALPNCRINTSTSVFPSRPASSPSSSDPIS